MRLTVIAELLGCRPGNMPVPRLAEALFNQQTVDA